jgi:transketolase
VLSKGHSAAALYVTLAEAGYFDPAELSTFQGPMSRLGGHPDRTKLPGVETNTGPLGHGMPVAVGIALAGKLTGAGYRTFALTGDGELQEGSIWEAAMAAAHYELDGLTVIVDRNGLQQGDRTESTVRLEPLADKWRAFGWSVREVDGHDHAALLETFRSAPVEPGRPNCVIAHTHKGQGVSFISDQVGWHHHVPTADEYQRAIAELQAGLDGLEAGQA